MSEPFPTDYKGWLGKLISFKTVSRYSNLPLIHYVRDYLKSLGIECMLIHNAEKTKANLWATLPGENGATKGGLVLSGHTDVVPTDGQNWDTDPFTMVEKDGRLYGRGSSDMLGYIAVVLSLTPYFVQMKRTRPIFYAFSYDEEFGCAGVPTLIDYLKEQNFQADGCIIGEPTDMKVWTGNKGLCFYEVKVHGKPIHSSAALMNTSCNAIEYAALIIKKIRSVALDIKQNGKRHNEFTPCPFACVTTSMIDGGNAVNTVPEHCQFKFGIRTVEETDAPPLEKAVQEYIDECILPTMREEFEGATVEFVRTSWFPAFNGCEDTFTKDIRKHCNHHEIIKSSVGTEAGYFYQTLKIPTVIVGPGNETLHLPNENVEISMMDRCDAFLKEFVKFFTTAP